VTPDLVTYITQHEWRHDPCEILPVLPSYNINMTWCKTWFFLEKHDVNYLMLESKVQHTHTHFIIGLMGTM
jgi:hypothetical protein